jgi:hypothetical protein
MTCSVCSNNLVLFLRWDKARTSPPFFLCAHKEVFETALASQAFEFILTALFLAAVSYAILVTRALPRWTGWLGVGIAVLNLAAVPAIFRGNDFMEAVIAG